MRIRKQRSLASPVFFVDRSIECHTVIDALKKAGPAVESHSHYFKADAEDTEWLIEVGRRGWVVLSRDKRIRYRAIEKQALVAADVRAFILTASGNMRGEEMASLIVEHMPKMLRLLEKQRGPFIASITRSGVNLL